MIVEVYQQDWIPGFAAFNDDGEVQANAKAHVVINIGALMVAVETKDIEPGDVPYIVAESIMHEVIHALEAWAGVEFNDDRVEALLMEYRKKYAQPGTE